ncbi:MAG TPA: XkdF-like putative serine protease domain-containing protein, partial [Pseudodesulfovibrio sp.]|nr:XkdF-like putative serine protease domain-containing protein [Pseudodesulfovibrio sp.]
MPIPEDPAKNLETPIASGTLTKIDADRQIAFGWAYTAQIGDKLIVDHSGDFIDEEAIPYLEDAVYEFVLESREADEMHERFTGVGKI